MVIKPLKGFLTAIPSSLFNKPDGLMYEVFEAGESMVLSTGRTAILYSPLPLALKTGDEVILRIWTDLWMNGQVVRIYAPDICLILTEENANI
jgi:hypothetical protein